MIIIKKFIFLFFFNILLLNNLYAAAPILPSDANATLQTVYQQYKNLREGKNADYIPELAKVNPALFGIAIVTVDGKILSAGDADQSFAIESISKPFVYALALEDQGEAVLTSKIGLNATGEKFNSVLALEILPHHLENPLVNAGAIQVTSFIKGKDSEEKWQRVLKLFQDLSDGKPYLGEAVYQSEAKTNEHNQAIAMLLKSYGMLDGDPKEIVDRYTKDCSIMVSAKQLAIMGATLANGGVNPVTHQRLFQSRYVRDALAEMVVYGLYENSGAWWVMVGLPAKSGVGGGLLAVVPGKMAIVVFSPPLDDAGNSVRGQAVIKDLSQRWGLHLLGK